MNTKTESYLLHDLFYVSIHFEFFLKFKFCWNLFIADEVPRSQGVGNHGDLASVMSFTSTNTSSSHGSNRGQPRVTHQVGPIPLQIPPQQLGGKVTMLYFVFNKVCKYRNFSRSSFSRSSLCFVRPCYTIILLQVFCLIEFIWSTKHC